MAPLYDPRLVRRDLRDRRSQKRRVIDADGRDDRNKRILHHVRHIICTSHSRLQDQNLHTGIPENTKSHVKQKLKVGRMKRSPRSPFLTGSLHLQKRPYKIRLRDHHPADQKPLPDIHQMRRNKRSARDSRFAEHRCQKSTNRTLSVRPGNMDHLKLPVRIAQKPEKLPYLRDPALLPRIPRDCLDLIPRLLHRYVLQENSSSS